MPSFCGGYLLQQEPRCISLLALLPANNAGGQERLPVWAVNDTEDGEVPAFFELGRLPQKKDLIHAHLGISDARV